MEEAQLCTVLERLELDNSCSIRSLLENDLCGEPVLHAALTLPSENKRQIVKALIEASADCDRRDAKNLTPCEYALIVLDDRELASEMIATELRKQPDDRAFYVMIRRGSLPVFKLFLELRKLKESRTFELMANAMVQLNMKKVPISGEVDAFIQYWLTEYAFRYLRGTTKTKKNINEWRTHFKVIEDNWNALKERYNDRDYSNVDNEFVHRIQTIHNHIYFVKDKRFLKHLPMMEIVFCLAVFSAILKSQSYMEIFKWMINKLNIMQFLNVICRQLKKVEAHLNRFEKQLMEMFECFAKTNDKPSKELMTSCWSSVNPSEMLSENIINKIVSCFKEGFDNQTTASEVIANESFKLSYEINFRDRSTLVRLRRCYSRTKQLYSILKCIFHIQSLPADILESRSDQSSNPAVRRVIQVIGEAIKSTKNSPNVPKKIEAALSTMLTDVFPTTNRNMREFFSHKYSLAKQYLLKLSEANYCTLLPRWFEQVEMIFLVIFLCSTVEASRHLLGSMKRCNSVPQLRSLLQYIGNQKIMIEVQTQQFKKLENMLSKISNGISSTNVPSKENQPKFENLQHGLKLQEIVLVRIQRCLISQWKISLEAIKVACLGKADLITIHRMITWNLTICDHSEIYDEIKRNWYSNHVTFLDLQVSHKELINYNPSVMTGILQQHESMLKTIEGTEYVKETRQIFADLGHPNPPEELINTLNLQLSKYYEDIFAVDNKYKSIKNLFKTRKLPIDEERYKSMRKKDEEFLKKIFDDRVNDMRTMLQTYGLLSIPAWSVKIEETPPRVLLGLEYYLLETSEMLISVGYFGDNFHLLKHRIPLMHGRNFRNCLAHDSLSYDILTDSAQFKVIANAFVLVNNPVNLFGKQEMITEENLKFVTPEQTLQWVKIQVALANSLRRMDCGQFKSCVNEGADISGTFCGLTNNSERVKCDITSTELVDPNCSGEEEKKAREIWMSLSSDSTVDIFSPSYRTRFAFQRGEFTRAVGIFTKERTEQNSRLPEYFYHWEHLVNHLPSEFLDFHEKDQHGRTILHRLVKAGNYEGVSEILQLHPDADINAVDEKGNSAFDLAIYHGFIEIAKLMSTKNPKFSPNNREFAMMNHVNDLLPQLFADYDTELLLKETYIMIAIRANNCAALKFIIDHLYVGPHSNLKNKHLASGTTLAAYFNHFQIVEFLLSLPNMDFFTDQSIASGHPALHFAFRFRNWSAVKLLLKHGASPNWVHPMGSLPHRTAFQLAVNAGNRQVLGLMEGIDTRLYSSLKHPLSVAIRSDSPKMIRHLQHMGFSLLDSNRILNTAVKCGSIKYVNQVFQALDASIDEWKRHEGHLGMIGQLLSRWKAFEFLEQRETNSVTPFMQAIDVNNWPFVTLLLNKSRELRKIDERYISNIEVYFEKNLFASMQWSEELDKSCVLLKLLKDYVENQTEKSTIVPVIVRTLENIRIDCQRITFSDSSCAELDLTSIPSTSNQASNCLRIAFLAMRSIRKSKDFILGTIQENPEVLHYFIAFSDVSCFFRLYRTEPPQLLQALVNTPSAEGETPLHMVSIGDSTVDQMKLLLENGANPIAANSIGLTPLHISLMDLDSSKSMLLLNHCITYGLRSPDGTPALEIPNGHRWRPIHYAALFRKNAVIKLLLEHKVNVRVMDQLGYHPAMYAVASFDPKTLGLFVDYDPELLKFPNDRGETVLHCSAKYENEAGILMLLEHDVDVAAADKEGKTAIEIAIGHANAPWVKIVLFYARVNGIRGLFDRLYGLGFPPVHYCVMSNRGEIVRAVVEYEIDQDLDEDLSDTSLRKLHDILTRTMEPIELNVLHVAVRYFFKESVEILLFCQARYNQYSDKKIFLAQEAIDAVGKTPLDYAMESQDEVLINMLLNG